MVCELIQIKNTIPAQWGPKKVRTIYQQRHGQAPSESSVKRVLDKAGFVNHRKRRRRDLPAQAQEGIRPEKPNQQWSVDFKGWWKTANGDHCEPLTVRDGFSRYILDLRAMNTTKTEPVRDAFEQLFEQYGLPESIRSDNGTPFASPMAPRGLSRLSAWWITLGIRLDRIDPGRPDQNGAHERVHRDIRAELQLNPQSDLDTSQVIFDQWRNIFNWQRPHEGIEMKMPGDLYQPSSTPYQTEPVDLSYPPHWLERRVTRRGNIKLGGTPIDISSTLGGYVVGLEPINGRLDVWFDYLKLGHIDLEVHHFKPVTAKKRRRSSSGRLADQRKKDGQ